MNKPMKQKEKFQSFLRWMLLYTLLIILWGAWVRISHSGDGCGQSWPLCKGAFIPEMTHQKTWVEFIHRLMSGSFGILVIAIFVFAKKLYPSNHPIRKWALLSLIFTMTEALLGAKLVLFKLVGGDDSPFRAFAMSLHFVNSLMLTGSIFLTYDYSKYDFWQKRIVSVWKSSRLVPLRISMGLVISFVIIGISGAIAALANTLFPSDSLLAGFQADFSGESHYLIRMRGLHPMLGILFGGSIALTAYLSTLLQTETAVEFRQRSQLLGFVTASGILVGIITLFSLSPIWLKLTHLLLAHLIWMSIASWIRELRVESQPPKLYGNGILFFDGVCNLCNFFVDFTIDKQNRNDSFKYSSFQGSTAKQVLPAEYLSELNTVVLNDHGKTYVQAEAIFQILKKMKFPWPVIAIVARCIPLPISNFIYQLVAKSRYKLFGRKPSCRIPTAQERSLFLD